MIERAWEAKVMNLAPPLRLRSFPSIAFPQAIA